MSGIFNPDCGSIALKMEQRAGSVSVISAEIIFGESSSNISSAVHFRTNAHGKGRNLSGSPFMLYIAT